MELSKHVLVEARNLLSEGGQLPKKLESAPLFYLAEAQDTEVLAFSTINQDGKVYKIGTKTAN